MNKQPLYATLLALALGGCVAQKPALDVAPIPAPLHSEFKVEDEDASFFGPFLAATQDATLETIYFLLLTEPQVVALPSMHRGKLFNFKSSWPGA